MTKEITQAFLIKINTVLEYNQYSTYGLYSFGSKFLYVELVALRNNPNPALCGDIADVHYICKIKKNDPFKVSFDAFLHSHLIRPNVQIEKLTQAQAFEQCAANMLKQYNESSEFCDIVFSKTDVLKLEETKPHFSEERIKEFSCLISKQYIPCSSLNISKDGGYHRQNFLFSKKDKIEFKNVKNFCISKSDKI